MQKHTRIRHAYLPICAWLALSAYGDPDFRIPSIAHNEHIPMNADRSATWHSRLRSYIVLRTEDSLEGIRETLGLAPTPVKASVNKFLKYAFLEPPASNISILTRIEKQAHSIRRDFGAESLSLTYLFRK